MSMDFIFFLLLWIGGIMGSMMVNRLIDISQIFVMFCVLPLFILNGDKSFRRKVLLKGIWKAVKSELFSTSNHEE